MPVRVRHCDRARAFVTTAHAHRDEQAAAAQPGDNSPAAAGRTGALASLRDRGEAIPLFPGMDGKRRVAAIKEGRARQRGFDSIVSARSCRGQ
jgi:hypothetical protein